MLVKELKEIYGVLGNDNISVIGFSDDWKQWWHIHDDEEVSEEWAFRLNDYERVIRLKEEE